MRLCIRLVWDADKGQPLWEFCLCSVSYRPHPVRRVQQFSSGSGFCNAEYEQDEVTDRAVEYRNKEREKHAEGHTWPTKGGGREFRGRNLKGRQPHNSSRKWETVRREAKECRLALLRGVNKASFNVLWEMQVMIHFLKCNTALRLGHRKARHNSSQTWFIFSLCRI